MIIMKEMMKLDGMPIALEEDSFYVINNLHVRYPDLLLEFEGGGGGTFSRRWSLVCSLMQCDAVALFSGDIR